VLVFIDSHIMRDASAMRLNAVSGMLRHSRAEVPARDAVRGLWQGLREWVGGESPAAMRSERRVEGRMRFDVETLGVEALARPAHEPDVLYVRIAAPRAQGQVAVLPDAGARVARELGVARDEGHVVKRAVVVGADSFFVVGAETAPGRDDALHALESVFHALRGAGVPFVWRTRAGLTVPLPGSLATTLAACGPLAVVELGVPALDVKLVNALEGKVGAPPQDRLRLATALTVRGVVVRGLVDPLVPMLTDQQADLERLVRAFVEAGVHRIGARYLVLTQDRAKALAGRLTQMQQALIRGVFSEEPWRRPETSESGPREVHKVLAGHLRRRGHHRLTEIGARLGVHVDLLDRVTEAEDVTDHSDDNDRVGGEDGEADRRRPVRRRPQLELFRKRG
jgi:hypothetical protein